MRTTIGAIVEGGTSINYRTGDWRDFRPVFINGVAPCQRACPAGIDITSFMHEAKYQRYDKAWQIIMQDNPFPSICGRVCGHPCEEACNRKAFDEPLAINALERYVGDYGFKSMRMVPIQDTRDKEVIAVVGSGPAGLSCAYHLRRLGYAVKVFERLSLAGGMLRWGIPDYRLLRTVLDREIENLRCMGIEIETAVSLSDDFLTEGLGEFKAIFLALGAQKGMILGIDGENLPGVLRGLDFLRKVKRGDPPRLGQRVLVVGGGNTAIDVARTVLRLGSTPTLIYRRTRTEMPAVGSEVEEALNEGTVIQFLTSPVAITESMNQCLRLECVKNRLVETAADNRRIPVPVAGSNFFMETDSIIIATGEIIDTDDLSGPLFLKNGGVVTDEWGVTQLAGIFAGGDLTGGEHRTVSHAIGSGRRAASAIHAFVRGDTEKQVRLQLEKVRGRLSAAPWINPPVSAPYINQPVAYEDLNSCYFEPVHREIMSQISDITKRIKSFEEVNLGFSEDQASREAERCFQCGSCSFCMNCFTFCPDSAVLRQVTYETFTIDYEFCKGCGICANECPSHFIKMIHEEK